MLRVHVHMHSVPGTLVPKEQSARPCSEFRQSKMSQAFRLAAVFDCNHQIATQTLSSRATQAVVVLLGASLVVPAMREQAWGGWIIQGWKEKLGRVWLANATNNDHASRQSEPADRTHTGAGSHG